MGMLPGFNSDMMPQGNDKASQVMIKRYITIIESMTDDELDTTNIKKLHEASRWVGRGGWSSSGHCCCEQQQS
jgi:signal recognition particle subunit SRP54